MGASESQCCSIYPAAKKDKIPGFASIDPRVAGSETAKRPDGRRTSQLASLSLTELRTFSDFIKEKYLSSGDAFDKMFKTESNYELGTAAHLLETQRVDRNTFEHRCAVAGFTGTAGIVFDLLKDTDDYITKGGFKFQLTLPPATVIKNWQGTSYVSPAAGQDPALPLSAFAPVEIDSDELAKREDNVETFKKMNRQHSLGSASTVETCSESPRKSRRLENKEDVEAVASTPPLHRKLRKTSVEILKPTPGNGRKARPTPTPLNVACAFEQARGLDEWWQS